MRRKGDNLKCNSTPGAICNESTQFSNTFDTRNLVSFSNLQDMCSRHSQNYPQDSSATTTSVLGLLSLSSFFPFFHIEAIYNSRFIVRDDDDFPQKKSGILIFFRNKFPFYILSFLFVWEIASWFFALWFFFVSLWPSRRRKISGSIKINQQFLANGYKLARNDVFCSVFCSCLTADLIWINQSKWLNLIDQRLWAFERKL